MTRDSLRPGAAQDLPRLLDVARDLRAERLGAGELHLVAEPGDEAQLQVLLIEVAVEVQEVRLHAQVGLAERGPIADADRRLVLAVGRARPPRVDRVAW